MATFDGRTVCGIITILIVELFNTLVTRTEPGVCNLVVDFREVSVAVSRYGSCRSCLLCSRPLEEALSCRCKEGEAAHDDALKLRAVHGNYSYGSSPKARLNQCCSCQAKAYHGSGLTTPRIILFHLLRQNHPQCSHSRKGRLCSSTLDLFALSSSRFLRHCERGRSLSPVEALCGSQHRRRWRWLETAPTRVRTRG